MDSTQEFVFRELEKIKELKEHMFTKAFRNMSDRGPPAATSAYANLVRTEIKLRTMLNQPR